MTSVKGKKRERRELSAVDIRFLKAVDILLSKNKKEGLKPRNSSELSQILVGSKDMVTKVRSGFRGVSLSQLVSFATQFNIDYNYFFRDGIKEIFHSDLIAGHGSVVSHQGVQNNAPGATTIQMEHGDMTGSVYSGEVKASIGKVVNLIPKEVQVKFNNLLEELYSGVTELDTKLSDKSEEIKKISDHSSEIISGLQEQLKSEKEDKMLLMEKYTKVMEKLLG